MAQVIELNLKFTQNGETAGDATTPYIVSLNRECTLREFIEVVLKRGEWGYIGVKCKGAVFGKPSCEYRYDKLLNSEFLEDDLNRVLNSNIIARGGWTWMSYLVTFKESEESSLEERLCKISEATLAKLCSLSKISELFSIEEVLLLARIFHEYGHLEENFSNSLLQASLALNQIATENIARPAELRVFTQLGLPIIEYLARDFGFHFTYMFKLICDEKVTFSDVKNALNRILLRELN